MLAWKLSLPAAIFAVVLGIAGLTANTASAYVACNDEGDCWHTDRHDHWREVRVHWHPDGWYFHHDWDRDRDHHWRGHRDERGYWHNGQWEPHDYD